MKKMIRIVILCLLIINYGQKGKAQTGVPSCPSIVENHYYEIPVIVHAMYNEYFDNVEYQEVVDMINNVNDQLQHTQIGDYYVDIRLKLVNDGTCTPGYEKVYNDDPKIRGHTEEESISEDIRIKENNVWDVNNYLNIWIVSFIDWETTLEGYATMPYDEDYIDGIVLDDDKLYWLIHYFGEYANLFKPWENNGGSCLAHYFCENGDQCDDIIELNGPWELISNDENADYNCEDWLTGFCAPFDNFTIGNAYVPNPLCFPEDYTCTDPNEERWYYPADNFMTYQENCWSRFTDDQYIRMAICFKAIRKDLGSDITIIDLSSNEDHSVDDLLQALGVSIGELCNSTEKYRIVLGGNLILDSSPGESVCFGNGTTIQMLQDAKITVTNNTTLEFDDVHVFACDVFWDKIDVEAGSSIIVSNNTLIEDAYNAIYAEKGANVTVENSIFNNNYIGIYLRSFGTGIRSNVDLSNCTFTSDESFYIITDGTHFDRPFTGIYVSGQNRPNLRAPEDSRNTYNRLQNGIIAYNSTIRVYFSDFFDINKGLYLSNLPTVKINRPGYAIKIINGFGPSVLKGNTMLDVSYAIGEKGGMLVAKENTITDTKEAIYGYDLHNAKIYNNEIEARESGIFISESYMSPWLNKIHTNYVTINSTYDYATAVDIQFTNDMDIYNNNVYVEANKAGIYLLNSLGISVEDNDVYVDGNYNTITAGIALKNADDNIIYNNYLEDNTGSTTTKNRGVFVTHSDNVQYECNHTHEFMMGMHFFINCDESVLKGNQYYSNVKDLVLGDAYDTNTSAGETVIGVQGDFNNLEGWGNLWPNGGVVHNSAEADVVDLSQFLVKESLFGNTGYLPDDIEAAGTWFWDDAAGNLFPCSGDPGSDLPPKCEYIIERLIKLDTTTTMDECVKVMWQYKYYKRLLELKKKGLLSPACLAYFNSQFNNIFLQIANISSAIDSITVMQTGNSLFNDLYDYSILLDSLYDTGNVNTNEWNETMLKYTEIVTEYQIVLQDERNRDISKSDSVRTVITTITVTDSCLQVLLDVYKIRLNLIKSDTLTSSEISYLQSIAESCPTEYGESVFWARSMMSLYENKWYPNMEDCLSGNVNPRSDESIESVEKKLQVFPNPASGEVSINIETGKDERGIIQLLDIGGNELYNASVDEINNRILIDLNRFSSGVYLIKYTSNKGEEKIDKLVITN